MLRRGLGLLRTTLENWVLGLETAIGAAIDRLDLGLVTMATSERDRLLLGFITAKGEVMNERAANLGFTTIA